MLTGDAREGDEDDRETYEPSRRGNSLYAESVGYEIRVEDPKGPLVRPNQRRMMTRLAKVIKPTGEGNAVYR